MGDSFGGTPNPLNPRGSGRVAMGDDLAAEIENAALAKKDAAPSGFRGTVRSDRVWGGENVAKKIARNESSIPRNVSTTKPNFVKPIKRPQPVAIEEEPELTPMIDVEKPAVGVKSSVEPEPKLPKRMRVINNLRRRRAGGVMDLQGVVDVQVPKRRRVEKIWPEMGKQKSMDEGETQDDFRELGFRQTNDDGFGPGEEMGVVRNLDGSVPEMGADPTYRPMEKVPTLVVKKPRRMRKGYVVAMLMSILVAAGCAVTAVLLLVERQTTDPVAKAVQRIIDGEAWNNLIVEGTVSVKMPGMAVSDEMGFDGHERLESATGSGSEIGSLKTNLQMAIVADSAVNSISTATDITFKNGRRLTLEANEIYGSGGDLYFKIRGAANLLTELKGSTENSSEEEEEEVEDEVGEGKNNNGATDSVVVWTEALGILDGAWVKVPASSLAQAWSGEQGVTACTKKLVGGLKDGREKLKELYVENPFIVSSKKDEGEISKRRNQVYLVQFDERKLTAFVEGVVKIVEKTGVLECLGISGSDLKAGTIVAAIAKGPEIYAEVDANYNLTRILIRKALADGGNVEADLNFADPLNLNIGEPEDYMEAGDLLNGNLPKPGSSASGSDEEVPSTEGSEAVEEGTVENVEEEEWYEEEWTEDEWYEDEWYEEEWVEEEWHEEEPEEGWIEEPEYEPEPEEVVEEE